MKTLRPFYVVVVLLLLLVAAHAASYKYKRIGSDLAAETHIEPGVALMGGGTDLDEAFKWLCGKGNGGDFLILRARGKNDYNPYVNKICQMNSVATLVIPDRKAAQQVKVARIIRQASVIFIAGGNQARYVEFWKGTPVEEAVNAHVLAGKPIGGTSAGLAVLGEFVYGSMQDRPDDPDLTSRVVLDNPYEKHVTLERDFLKVPGLENILTDSHFAKRDRMGRSLGFLARIVADGWSKTPREIAIDEKSAVLMEVNGSSKIVGSGEGAYFLQITEPPQVCKAAQPLTLRNIEVYHAPTGSTFNVRDWKGKGGEAYSISVDAGQVRTSRADGKLY
ncbi:MAG TPA: cyanophycinase [Candidatus Sulfotelmatobacter sp.]|jgi:cyanophycinase